MKTNRNTDKIRALNDNFRQTFIGGHVMKTEGVAALDEEVQQKIIAEVNMGSSVYSTVVPANGVLYITNRNQLYALAATPAAKPAETPAAKAAATPK